MPLNGSRIQWWLTNVYGPTARADKEDFLAELCDVRTRCPGPWLLCGDFNLIYMARDKNNGRLHRGLMRRFRGFLDDLQLEEIHLSGRLFTWSNGRDQPMLERLDRAFATIDWFEQFPNHLLRCLSSDCSDHAPLLLVFNSEPWAPPRFWFDQYWAKVDGFLDVVRVTWGDRGVNMDACRNLDQKLRAVARALKSWRASCVGNVRLQLAAARVIIYEFETAQKTRQLSQGEIELRRELKATTLGLALLTRTMARQRARTRHLREGEACTKYFHLQACHRRRKNYLLSISHDG